MRIIDDSNKGCVIILDADEESNFGEVLYAIRYYDKPAEELTEDQMNLVQEIHDTLL